MLGLNLNWTNTKTERHHSIAIEFAKLGRFGVDRK